MGKLIKYNTALYGIFLTIVYISKLNETIINIGFFVLIIINTLVDLIITIKTKEIEEAINTYMTTFTFLSFCIIAIGLVIGKETQEGYSNIVYTLTLPTTIAIYASKVYLQATNIFKEKYIINKIKENIRIIKKLLNIIWNIIKNQYKKYSEKKKLYKKEKREKKKPL